MGTMRHRPPRITQGCRGQSWNVWSHYPLKTNTAGTPYLCYVCGDRIEKDQVFYAAGESAAHEECGEYSDAHG